MTAPAFFEADRAGTAQNRQYSSFTPHRTGAIGVITGLPNRRRPL
jgi:hypothetical protein